jgi:hypothetical protein
MLFLFMGGPVCPPNFFIERISLSIGYQGQNDNQLVGEPVPEHVEGHSEIRH